MPDKPTTLELAAFSKHVGDDFRIRVGAEVRTAKLLEATGQSDRNAEASQPASSFSLLFHDPAATVATHLAQGIYRFEHAELGSLELFLVPVGPDRQATGICYEVIFNLRGT